MGNTIKTIRIHAIVLYEDILEFNEDLLKSTLSWFRSTRTGLLNFWKWRKIIYNDRWYDYEFLLDVMEFKLVDMEKNWVVNTHHVGDEKTKLSLQEIIEDLRNYRYLSDEAATKEEKIKSDMSRKKFFDNLGDKLEEFWD